MEEYIESQLMNWEIGKVKGFSGKQLIDLENGGLKIVKIDPLAKYPLHLHPEKTEFIYVLEGSPEITIGTNTYNGKSGDFYIMSKKIKHRISNPMEVESVLLVGAIKV